MQTRNTLEKDTNVFTYTICCIVFFFDHLTGDRYGETVLSPPPLTYLGNGEMVSNRMFPFFPYFMHYLLKTFYFEFRIINLCMAENVIKDTLK